MAEHGYEGLVKFIAAALGAITALLAAKVGAWLLTGSLTILALTVDTAFDALGALGAYVAVKVSSAPPDSDHAYGHWKAESVGGLAISLLVVGTCSLLVYTSVAELLAGHPGVREGSLAVVVIVVSLVVKLALSNRLAKLASDYSSQAAGALTIHLKSDVATYSAATAAVLLASHGASYVDALGALVAAFYFAALGLRKAQESIGDLMDRAPPGITETVVESLSSVDGVVSVPSVRARRSGPRVFIDATITVPRTMSIEDAHSVATSAEEAVKSAIKGADVVVHVEPAGGGEKRRRSRRSRVKHEGAAT